jgi:hypothetical protein
MKLTSLFVAFLLLGIPASQGQNRSERKTMIFQPGAKTPDAPATAPKATPVPKAPAAPAGTAAGGDEPARAAAAFFGLLQRGAIDDAYASLTKGSKIGESPDELRNLKAKTVEAIDVFGAILGHELIETKKVGVNLMRRTYLSLGKEFPLRWRFYFYKTEGVWKLVDLRVDDRLAGMFEEPEETKVPEQKP